MVWNYFICDIRHIKKEKEIINSYFNTFHMHCDNNVIKRFRQLQEKLADKHMIFKFNGNKYAIFSMNQFKRSQFTDYTLSLEDVEEFAEKG